MLVFIYYKIPSINKTSSFKDHHTVFMMCYFSSHIVVMIIVLGTSDALMWYRGLGLSTKGGKLKGLLKGSDLTQGEAVTSSSLHEKWPIFKIFKYRFICQIYIYPFHCMWMSTWSLYFFLGASTWLNQGFIIKVYWCPREQSIINIFKISYTSSLTNWLPYFLKFQRYG